MAEYVMFIATMIACSVLLCILIYVSVQYEKLNDFLRKTDLELKRMQEDHLKMHSFYKRKASTTVNKDFSRFDSMRRRV
tara:strand:- start:153 stop:389 length:237 start_codon:yes stop_codon:yes gene_type:complete